MVPGVQDHAEENDRESGKEPDRELSPQEKGLNDLVSCFLFMVSCNAMRRVCVLIVQLSQVVEKYEAADELKKARSQKKVSDRDTDRVEGAAALRLAACRHSREKKITQRSRGRWRVRKNRRKHGP